jgi:hypothetical protein
MVSWWLKRGGKTNAWGQLIDCKYFDFNPPEIIEIGPDPCLIPMKTIYLSKK